MRSSPVSLTGSEAPAGVGNITGTIFNIQRFSIEDGPGIRTTVFMKGCPLRCVWCHNPEGLEKKKQLMWFDVRCIGARDCLAACTMGALKLTGGGMVIDRERCDGCGRCQEACPAGAIEVVGREITAREAFDEVARDEAFYRNSGGGLTISGGEPTMQPGFVEQLLTLAGDAGVPTALDTCGYCSHGVLAKLLELSDMAMLDLKVMDEARHVELTGVELAPVLESGRVIARSGTPLWVRTPVIPGCTDTEENIGRIARYIREDLSTVERWDLLSFNNTCGSKYQRLGLAWELERAPLISKRKMESLAEAAQAAGCRVEWSGVTGDE
ncbi:MAG: glycyl-radical enzyme activating protein [Candidatus Geothermincolia bacterium]